MAAALSFYTLFAIPSLILIALNIVNIIFTNVKAREILLSEINGAAGSLLVLLIWIYYLANIFFFGAEFTRVFSHLHGNGIKLSKGIINRKDFQLPKKS